MTERFEGWGDLARKRNSETGTMQGVNELTRKILQLKSTILPTVL